MDTKNDDWRKEKGRSKQWWKPTGDTFHSQITNDKWQMPNPKRQRHRLNGLHLFVFRDIRSESFSKSYIHNNNNTIIHNVHKVCIYYVHNNQGFIHKQGISRSTDYMTDPCHDDPTTKRRSFWRIFFWQKEYGGRRSKHSIII